MYSTRIHWTEYDRAEADFDGSDDPCSRRLSQVV
jgi:hypothetical protein